MRGALIGNFSWAAELVVRWGRAGLLGTLAGKEPWSSRSVHEARRYSRIGAGVIKARSAISAHHAHIDNILSLWVYSVMSDPSTHTPEGAALTELILEIFRLNGALLGEGDRLVGDIGLTSARWQVMGAAALSPVPLPVAAIARNMGLTRQAVQRVANDLAQAGFVRFAPNPHHQRAQLVVLTASGTAAYRAAIARQGPWANRIAAGLDPRRIKAARAVLRTIAQQLDGTRQAGAKQAAARPRELRK